MIIFAPVQKAAAARGILTGTRGRREGLGVLFQRVEQDAAGIEIDADLG